MSELLAGAGQREAAQAVNLFLDKHSGISFTKYKKHYYLERRANCAGYAHMCEIMGVIAGLRVGRVHGVSNEINAGGHSWNAAILDGKWVFFDATWDLWDMAPDYHSITSRFDYNDGIYRVSILDKGTEDGSVEMSFGIRWGLEGQCPANLTIPDRVTQISGFYQCTNLESVNIPNSVTTIGNSAFLDCTSLKSITIPNSVTTIERMAFSNTGLTSVTIPSSVTTLSEAAFYECADLTSVTIPSSVTSIDRMLFQGCTSLTDIVIPNGVTSIGDQAFMGCTNLERVTIPDGVTTIGGLAFFQCENLKHADLPDSVTDLDPSAFSGCPNLKLDGTLPGGMTTIPAYMFRDRTDITSFVIPDGVTDIGYQSFQRCTNLESVTIPDSVTALENGAFSLCSGLTSVTIPNSITTLEDFVFSNCTGLTSITIPDSVTSIGEFAFNFCTNLESITIPNSVTTFGGGAFARCESLTSVTLPNKLTAIPREMFQECTALTSVFIPSGVTSIDNWAFESCRKLTDVYFGGTEAQWKAIQIGEEKNQALTSATIHYNSTMPGAPAAGKTKFSDVPAGAFYEDAVAWAVEKNITVGTSATAFSPNSTCTTAQILTFLWRASSSPEPAPGGAFSDVSPDDFYYKAALWAKETGLVSGDTFGGNTPCTRSATVTYLWKLSGSPAASSGSFTDVPSGADYAQAVAWAVEKGVTSGTGGDMFSPDATCTRGQIVTFLYRYFVE